MQTAVRRRSRRRQHLYPSEAAPHTNERRLAERASDGVQDAVRGVEFELDALAAGSSLRAIRPLAGSSLDQPVNESPAVRSEIGRLSEDVAAAPALGQWWASGGQLGRRGARPAPREERAYRANVSDEQRTRRGLHQRLRWPPYSHQGP